MGLDAIPNILILIIAPLPFHLKIKYIRYKIAYYTNYWFEILLVVLFTLLGFLIKYLGRVLNFNYRPWATLFFLLSVISFCILVYDVFKSKILKKLVKEKMPKEDKKISTIAALHKRKSIRSYIRRRLTKEHVSIVNKLISETTKGMEIKVHLVHKEFKALNISDSRDFLVVIMPKKFTDDHIWSVGRAVQKILNEIVKYGMSSCWIGGFMERNAKTLLSKEIFDPDKVHLACLVALGYESRFKSFMLKYYVNKNWTYRKENNELFFENEFGKSLVMTKLSKEMRDVFGATRFAPSASNEQMTRIVKIGNDYHFYKGGHSTYYSVLGVGISMTNWEMACNAVGKKGKFIVSDPQITLPNKTIKYFYTWKMD